MENFKIDPGMYLPGDPSSGSLVSPVIQDYKNESAFIQSQQDYANSISMPGDSITDLIKQIESYDEMSRQLLNQGNPNIPSGPGYNFNQEESYSKLYGALNPQKATLKASSAPEYLGPISELERYKDSRNFQKFGYVPSLGSEQEYRYGRAMTWGETIGKALGGGSVLAWDTFIEGWKGWGRMAEALFTWDGSKLMGSEQERYDMAKEQQAIFNKYAIYDTEQSEDSLMNRQFFGNMLQQAGFAVGAMGQAALEMYAGGWIGKAISAAAGGFAKARGLTEFVDVAELLNNTRKAQKVISNSERVTNALRNIPRVMVPLYGTAQDMVKLGKAGAGTLQLGLIGLGGIKRELSMFNMARSEAIFEAASTYHDLEDKLTKEFATTYGREPNQTELEKLRQTAENASSDNFWTNIGVLSVMNRIQFDNMFKNFNTTRKIFAEGVAPFEEDAFEVVGKVGGKTVRKVYEKGFIGRLGAIPDIAKTFGRRTAAWEATKSVGLGLMKFEGSEGAQELIQNASNQGLSDYYYDLYHGKKGYGDRLDRVLASIQNPLTDIEGAKTFLMGALTGRLIAPFSYAMGKVKLTKGAKEHEAKKAEAISLVNTYYSDPTAYVKEQIANVKVQNRAVQTMEEAAANHDRYTYYNAKDSAFAKAMASAIKLNLYDSFRDTLVEFGKEMTDEEFKTAFNMEPGKDNRQNVNELLNKVVNQMDEYHTLYHNLQDKYGDRIIPELYKNNKPEEYERVKLAKFAQDQAIEMLTTNVFKARQATKRAAQLQQEIGANKNIGASSIEVLSKLGSEQAINDHVAGLEKELKMYEQAGPMSADQRKIEREKKKELKLAQTWKDAYEDMQTHMNESYFPEGSVRKIYSAYEDLVNFYNKTEQKDTRISIEDMEETFTKIIDYIQLNRDNKVFIDAMNILADPHNSRLLIESFKSSIAEAGKRLQEEHREEINSIPNPEEKPEEKAPEQPVTPTPAAEEKKQETPGEKKDWNFEAASIQGLTNSTALATRPELKEFVEKVLGMKVTDSLKDIKDATNKYMGVEPEQGENQALEAALKEGYDKYYADAKENGVETPANYQQWKDFTGAAKEIRNRFQGKTTTEETSNPAEEVKENKETKETYTDQFDVSAINKEEVSQNIVDQILSSTEKSDNFDSKADDFFNDLTSCNL